jgi:predicted nucleic-acid-binding protein
VIALDTNVVVRLITMDDERQGERAVRLLAGAPGLLLPTVMLEVAWVLESTYSIDPSDVAEALGRLLGLPNVTAWDQEAANAVVEAYAAGMDFADAMHLAMARSSPADGLATFDKSFVKLARRLSGSDFVHEV